MKSLAQVGYEAYCVHCGGRSVRGDVLSEWNQLPNSIKGHWIAAAVAMRLHEEDDLK